MGRASAWSDKRVRELAHEFVPAADEVWRLQRGNNAESLFFQRSVNQGKVITDDGSRQGLWVLSPGGQCLAQINSSNPDRVLQTLRQGLENWNKLPDGARHLPGDLSIKPNHRWEDSYPEGGFILARYGRDLPRSEKKPGRKARWNKDFAWFTKAEARQWISKDPAPGTQQSLPEALALRLARFSLVDNVRGQTLPFAPSEIKAAEVTIKVQARKDKQLTLQIVGNTRAESDGSWHLPNSMWSSDENLPHSMETRLLGNATFDLSTETFTHFDLLAVGWRTGRTKWNGRHDAAPGPIGFRFVLAPPKPRIAPTFLADYGVDWVQMPDDPRQLKSL